MSDSGEICISGFNSPGSAGQTSIGLHPGSATLIWSQWPGCWRVLLDDLAGLGRRNASQHKLSVAGREGRRLLREAAIIPAPGQEVFVGTTVGEQLGFFGAPQRDGDSISVWLDDELGFDFMSRPRRSVWELSTGERRCLLMVSLALACPGCWIIHGPLERLDGIRAAVVCNLIGRLKQEGAIVLAGTSDPAGLLHHCDQFIAAGEQIPDLEYVGSGESAFDYLGNKKVAPTLRR
jgi:ABC-type transport system involved in cytochrome c biogenesis ATPase subunit